MSLSTFLARRDVRERFRQEFPKPKIVAGKELLAPPLSKRYSLVGTAFDYLLRFYLERLNPNAVQHRWVAEEGFNKLGEQAMGRSVYNIDAEELSFPDDDGSFKAGRTALNRARTAHDRYIASGKTTVPLLKGAIYLAQLDVVFRSGFVDEHLGVAHPEDVRDLRKLISLVNPSEFLAKRRCLLNPSFGDASRLVGGADADLVIDGMLIDIKTTKNFGLKREDFNQLIGYFVLHELSGLSNKKLKSRISKIAIYFSRHAHLEVFEVATLVNPETFPSFLQWFSDTAKPPSNRTAGRSNRA